MTRLLESDAGVESGRRGEKVRVRGGDEVVADHAVDVTEVADRGIRIVGVGAIAGERQEAETDAAGVVDQHVLLDDRGAAGVPEVDGVLGEPIVAPEARDPVAAHDPAPGRVRVDAAGVAVVADEGSTGVGELDRAALDRAVVGPALADRG